MSPCCRSCTETRKTHRDRDPHELPISPHGDRLNHTPLPNTKIAQGEPEQDGHADAVRVHEADRGREQAKVVLDDGRGRVAGVGEVGDDGGREGGADEEREDERGERPEGPVEVCAGREVRGGVVWRVREEGCVAATDDLRSGSAIAKRAALAFA